MLKVSVIVPVYNTEKYLKRCLDSIINQSLKEIEIIVVNDGSTDNSKNIIKSYEKKDSRIKIVNKPNGGLSSARNEGIKVAKSKYIAHIDSDDWVEYNYLEEMYLKAEKENLDIVISDIYWDYIDKIDYKRDLLISDKVIINSKEYLKLFFQGKILPAVCNKIYKTELYQSYNIFHPENISLGEDLSTSPLLAQNAKRIGKINKAYLHYYQNLESITKSNPTKKIYELISAFNILKNNIKKFDKKDIISLEIVHLSLLIFNFTFDINDKFYKKGLEYYFDLIQKEKICRNIGNKNRIYYKILQIFPRINTLKTLEKINKLGVRIKKIGKLK